MEPRVTAMCSHERKVRSLAKNVLGSMRIMVPWGGGRYSAALTQGKGREAAVRAVMRALKILTNLTPHDAYNMFTWKPVAWWKGRVLGPCQYRHHRAPPTCLSVGGGGGPLGPSSFLRKPSC